MSTQPYYDKFSHLYKNSKQSIHFLLTRIVLPFLLLFSSVSARGYDSEESEKNLGRMLSLLPGVEFGIGPTAFGGASVNFSYLKIPWPIVWQQVGVRHYGVGGNQFQLQGGLSLGVLFGGMGWRGNGRISSPFWTVGVPLFPIAFLTDDHDRDWDKVGWPAATLLLSSLWIERDLSKKQSTFIGFSFRIPVFWGKKSRTQKLESVAN
jgi:hypothetical protein